MGSLALCTVTKDPVADTLPCAGRPLIVPSAFTVNSTGPAPMYPAGAFVSVKRYLPGTTSKVVAPLSFDWKVCLKSLERPSRVNSTPPILRLENSPCRVTKPVFSMLSGNFPTSGLVSKRTMVSAFQRLSGLSVGSHW